MIYVMCIRADRGHEARDRKCVSRAPWRHSDPGAATATMPPVNPAVAPSISPWRLSVAPMMDWTDRHCRFFHRLITRARGCTPRW